MKRNHRIDPKGAFGIKCQNCAKKFRTNNTNARYCSKQCRRSARNKRHYQRHRGEIIARVMRNRQREA